MTENKEEILSKIKNLIKDGWKISDGQGGPETLFFSTAELVQFFYGET